LPVYTKFFAGKNLLAIHQLLANQTDINTTVSRHLLGNPVQRCIKASRAAHDPWQRYCLSDILLLQATGPSARSKGREGLEATTPQPHRAPQKATVVARQEQGLLCGFNFQSHIGSPLVSVLI
jgi:hypothetical protein